MRRSLKSRRDEDEFREAQQELVEIIEDHEAGDYDLYYFDEAGFSLIPTVPYGWEEKDRHFSLSPEGLCLSFCLLLSFCSFCFPSRESGRTNDRGTVRNPHELVEFKRPSIHVMRRFR